MEEKSDPFKGYLCKLVRIATALLKYGEKFSFEKAGISKAVLKQWELEQAKAA